MRPLEIMIGLRTPLCMGNAWLHFDGIIAHLCAREQLGEDYYTLPSKEPLPLGLDIPLAKTGMIYNASALVFDAEEVVATTIYQRFHEAGVTATGMRVKSINVVSGKFKAAMLKLPYIPAKRVLFYANGDVSRIRRLLDALPGLGKKVAIGFGEISSIDVREIEIDKSVVCDGVAMRPIPRTMLESASEVYYSAIAPPYWDKRNVMLCAPPGAEVRLCH